MTNKRIISIFSVFVITWASVNALGMNPDSDQAKSTRPLAQATSDLVSATAKYKASVEALIPIYESALKTATEMLEKRRQLYTQGIISKRDLETIEQQVKKRKPG